MVYIVKRLLIFIPTLLVISMITFGMSELVPEGSGAGSSMDEGNLEHGVKMDQGSDMAPTTLKEWDLPSFYMEIHSKELWGVYLPVFRWNGLENRYHHWLCNLLKGDFGTSYHDGQTVSSKLATPLKITLIMSVLSLLFAFGLAVPLGVYAAAHRGTRWERLLTHVLVGLYAVPLFWSATLVVIFFTNREYKLKIISTGLAELPVGASLWEQMVGNLPYFFLPVLCITLHSLAFIARQMSVAVGDALRQEYIKTAKAKGLSERRVVWRHAFRNALFPLITMFGQSLPAVVAGSLVVEIIFNIPGMGWEAYKAIKGNDYPVVYAVALLGAIMTLFGSLLVDILYRWANPKIS